MQSIALKRQLMEKTKGLNFNFLIDKESSAPQRNIITWYWNALKTCLYIKIMMEYHGQEPGHKKYDLNFNLGSGKQLQEVKILIILFECW